MDDRSKTVGVLMLETRFPRLTGDIGNPAGLSFPVIYAVVKGASPERVVVEKSQELLPPFIEKGKELVCNGANIITTSCGFLSLFQKQLQAASEVPVYTSSLLMFAELEERYGSGNVGILTISASSITRNMLAGLNIDPATPIGTTEGGEEFTRAILENRNTFDVELCRKDNVNAAMRLQQQNPGLKAFLLECTNMPPYAHDIEQATGLPVYSLNALLETKV